MKKPNEKPKKTVPTKVFISNKTQASDSINNEELNKKEAIEEVISLKDYKSNVIKKLSLNKEDSFHNFLTMKFIPQSSSEKGANLFNHLIAIKAPDGINAVVASPLLESDCII